VDLCPKLDGTRVVLHPLRTEHADALFPILNTDEVRRYATRPPTDSLDELREWFARLESRSSNDRHEYWLNWAIQEKISGAIIGFVQATADEVLSDASIAYVLGRSFWGQSLASDAVRTMLVHLRSLGVRTIRATVDSRNLRSVRLLERLGLLAVDERDPRDVVYAGSLKSNGPGP
jgi:[ribosomal protein S5]-alanine N-acetyltransferase